MSSKPGIIGLGALFIFAAGASAGPGPLDLIPADAGAAVAIRNLNDLKKKGDKFIAAAELKGEIRPSQLFDWMYQSLGIQGGVDQDNSAAIIIASPAKMGVKLSLWSLDKFIVVAVPFSDRDKLAKNFGFKKGELKPDKMMPGNNPNFGKFFYARGKHLFFGNNEKAVASVLKGKTLAAELDVPRRKELAKADILIQFSPPELGEDWKMMLKNLAESFEKAAEKDEQAIVRELIQTLAEFRFGVAALRIDDGVGISLLNVFPKKGSEAARKFLTALAAGPGGSRLTALPHGHIVAAQATRADGSKNALIAKVLVDYLLKYTLETKQVLSAADRPNFVGVFTDVWQRLKGNRLAVYQNGNEPKLGLFSVLAILDTDDAPKFLKEMKELARMADGSKLDLKTRTGPESDLARIEQLIRDLGATKFRVRHSATVKLGLIGEPVLPFLNKAIKSEDLEVARRAERLQIQITRAAAQRRKDLLAKDLTRQVKPAFVFVPRAELRDTHRINIVGVKLGEKDRWAVPQLRQLFGPDWDKIRLAVFGKQVVVLLGSDVALLEKALQNLKENKPGIAAAKSLAAFRRQSNPARKVEFHVSVERALALVTAPKGNRPTPAKASQSLTSFALTVDPEHLQLDIWVPSAEVKAVVKQRGW